MKYYAQQRDPETFDFSIYYNEDEAVCDKAWFGGNRSFGEINKELIEKAKAAINNYEYDIDQYDDVFAYIFDALDEDWNEFELREKGDKFDSICNEYIKNYKDENKYIAKVLELIYDEPFIYGTIRGNSQGDWLDYICPKSLEDRLDYIEAVLFATGVEYTVTEEQFESEPDFLSVNTYTVYCESSSVEKFKSKLADDLSCDTSEIAVYVISGRHTVTYFDYSEV